MFARMSRSNPGSGRHKAVPEPDWLARISAGIAIKSQLAELEIRTEQRNLTVRISNQTRAWFKGRGGAGRRPGRGFGVQAAGVMVMSLSRWRARSCASGG